MAKCTIKEMMSRTNPKWISRNIKLSIKPEVIITEVMGKLYQKLINPKIKVKYTIIFAEYSPGDKYYVYVLSYVS